MSIRQGIRIGFTGSGGTGKTTTAKFVSDITEIPLVKSAARTLYEEKNLTEDKVLQLSSEEKLKLQTEIFNKKIELDQRYQYIADRTILDHYCYCLAYCSSFMDNDYFLRLEEQVRTLMMSTYQHLFYFAWGYWMPESDGVRQDRLSWQNQIDALIVGYIVRWNLPVVHVPQTLGEDYRNQYVLSVIRGEIKNVNNLS